MIDLSIKFTGNQLKAYRPVSGLVFLFTLLLAVSLPGYADTEASQRGRHIYFQGEKANGESFTANVGAASIPVPATALTCAGCHGRDGEGKAEGGVRPSNISWFNLSRQYGGTTSIGRRFDRYDESSFLRAVSEGIDSAGNKLDSSMPRFNIARQDAMDLVAYLRVIQDDNDPGVSEDAIVLGSLQPAKPPHSDIGNAIVSVMQTRFDEINRQGGIYGRQLKLKIIPYEDRQSFVAQANSLITGDEVFALLNAYSASADSALIDMVEDAGMPSIGPYTQFPSVEDGRHHYTFYLHGGLDAQIAVLVKRIKAKVKNPGRVFVFYQQQGGFESNAKKAHELLQSNKIENAELIAYTANTTKFMSDLVDLDKYQNAAILFIGPSQDLVGLLSKPVQGPQLSQLYLPGFFVSSNILELDKAYVPQLEMTYITVPEGIEGEALSNFREFMSRNRLSHNFLKARLYAYSATQTLIEGVKNSGRRLTRKKLVDAIEGISRFDVGLNQPISFASQRRTGLLGAYVVKLEIENKRLSPTGTWVRLD